MRFYQLADIEIHIIVDTDNRFDVIFTKIPYVQCIWKNCHFKNTILVLVYENNVIKVCKIVRLISQQLLILQKCGR